MYCANFHGLPARMTTSTRSAVVSQVLCLSHCCKMLSACLRSSVPCFTTFHPAIRCTAPQRSCMSRTSINYVRPPSTVHGHLNMCSYNNTISLLEVNIDNFLTWFREKFPTASVTPKMHLLEDHVIPWLSTWRLGLGFHGEHGAESIHAVFNELGRRYCKIRNPLTRLHYMMKEHHLAQCPHATALRPAAKKRGPYKKKLADTGTESSL